MTHRSNGNASNGHANGYSNGGISNGYTNGGYMNGGYTNVDYDDTRRTSILSLEDVKVDLVNLEACRILFSSIHLFIYLFISLSICSFNRLVKFSTHELTKSNRTN